MMDRSVRGVVAVSALVSTSTVAFASCSSSSGPPGALDGMNGSDSSAVDSTAGDDVSTPTHDSSTPDATSSDSALDSAMLDSSAIDSETVDSGPPVEAAPCPDAGESVCNNLCTDLQTDSNNCGSCNHACSATLGALAYCSAGQCICQADAGASRCGSTCVDTLTDPNNCGTCGHICQVVGNTCAAGRCTATTIVQAGGPIWDFLVQGSTIYFTIAATSGSAGTVQSKLFSSSGSSIATLVGPFNDPRGVAIDNTYLYWVDYVGASVVQEKLLGGSEIVDWPQSLPEGGTGPTYTQPIDVAVNGSYIYWVANGSGQVLRVPINNNGNLPQVLSMNEDLPIAIAVDDNNVYWVDQGTGSNAGLVKQMKNDGTGSVTVLASNEPSPWDIAIDAHNVYWTDKIMSGFVKQVPIGGTGPVTTLASAELNPYGIAVDANNVYWTATTGLSVNSVPIGGGSKTVYAQQQTDPQAIAVDADNIYWVNAGTNSILAITK